jgi:thiamine biosynthesis lipoprotein
MAWYRSDRVRAMAEGREIVRSVSGATRGPGKYTVYYPEVAREHGTYQLVKQEMDFSGAPKQVRFSANTEVAASSFDYHKLTK